MSSLVTENSRHLSQNPNLFSFLHQSRRLATRGKHTALLMASDIRFGVPFSTRGNFPRGMIFSFVF